MTADKLPKHCQDTWGTYHQAEIHPTALVFSYRHNALHIPKTDFHNL